MASTPILDIAALLQPVSAECPQGNDVREDSAANALYVRIKDARNKARAAERASLFDPDQAGNALDLWRPILASAQQLIQQHSKDLEVASWLIEALIRFHDFAGLRDGFALVKGLVEKYWDNLYPLPDEDGIETRVAPLAGLNGDSTEGTLLAPIRNTAITPDGFNFWQYQQARDADRISDPDKKEEKIQNLGYSLQKIEADVAACRTDFFCNLVDDLEQSVQDFRSLNDSLRQHCGQHAPPFSLILETLEEILRSVRFLAKDKLASTGSAADTGTPQTSEAAPMDAANPSNGSSSPAGSSGPIANREDALRRLEEVARFFRATEPHTPLVSGIERLVRWGRMPMAELILELVPDATARAFYQHLTGANLSAGDSSASYAATASMASSQPATAEPDKPSW